MQPSFVYTTEKVWIDRGRYWEHTGKQGTQPWKDARKGRVTSSNGPALGGKSNFKTPEEIGEIIAGVREEVFSEKSIEYMTHGTITEPKSRKWFEDTYKCKVLERGLCVLKSDTRFGASVDGDIIDSDGCIEIKCPQKMYNTLLNYMENISHGWIPPNGFVSHIFPTHLYQCLQACYVLGKKYCIYIVYSVSTEQVFTQKIVFTEELWREHYNEMKKNYQIYVVPHLKDSQYPLIPF
jgi:hypothetical protein